MVGGVEEEGLLAVRYGFFFCVRIDGDWRGEVDEVIKDGGAKWGWWVGKWHVDFGRAKKWAGRV